MTDNLDEKEQKLKEKLESLKVLEKEILDKEKSIKSKEKAKKQMLLRLAPSLWDDLASWAEDEFRSINGQVEYLLSECVRNRKKNK